MHERFLFLAKFLRFGTRIASVTPSSRFLARAVAAHIPAGYAGTIIELGAGTGVITRELLSRVSPEARIIVVENDPDFAALLREKYTCSSVSVSETDAVDMLALARAEGLERVDYIISGLPTPSLKAADRERLFSGVRRILGSQGVFIQITEFPLVYYRFYKRFFESVRFSFVPWNMPPGGVYTCSSPREQ